LAGSGLIAVVARVQVDVKKVIAFSSVAHLNLVLASLFTGRPFGVAAFLIFSLTHG